jgi:hypothetical protein
MRIDMMRAIILPNPIEVPLYSAKAISVPTSARTPTPIMAYDLYFGVEISTKERPIPASDIRNVRIPPPWKPLEEAL